MIIKKIHYKEGYIMVYPNLIYAFNYKTRDSCKFYFTSITQIRKKMKI